MKAYVTKYALTEGILRFEGEVAAEGRMFCYRRSNEHFAGYAHGEGKDWHRTWAGAVARARLMRDKKILSLQKAAERLEDLDWPDAEPA